MNFLIIALLFCLQLVLFFSYGLLFFNFIHRVPTSITLTLLSGFLFYFMLFGILSIPLILTSQKLSTLTYSLLSISGIVFLVSLFLCREHWKDLLQSIPSSVRSHGIMIVPLFIFIFIFELFVFNHIDVSADASYYVGKVSTDVYTNTMGHYDPYTGNALSTLDGRRIFACFPDYNAVISQFFHIHPLKQAKVIMPQILSLFTCILYYQIGLLLFKGKKKNTDLFFCLILLLDFYSYTIYTAATFLFTRTYEGKSILANIIIPGMVYCFLLLWFKKDISFSKKLLFIISLSSCFFSSSSMLIVPIGLSAGLLPWIIKEKRWKDILFYLLCIMPNFIICVLYLLNTKGILLYSIQ